MRKLIYVLSGFTDRAIPFEWIAESSIGRDFVLSFVVLNNTPHSSLQRNLEATGCPVHYVPHDRKRDLPGSVLSMARLFRKLKPDVVHTHLTNANLAGLTAAKMTGVPKRIYTRHHTTLHHDYYQHAVYYDRTANFLATDIIATCENGRKVLQTLESVEDRKISLINIGFKLDHFKNVAENRVQVLRKKYGIESSRPVIGVVSKYIEWKGIQYAIPAFKKILDSHPRALLVLANARPSTYSSTIQELLKELPGDSYREIVFEEDAPALFKLFDVFLHLPVDAQVEAFGQVYIEALAAGVPSVFTPSGIAQEFARDSENCLVAPFRDAETAAEKALRLLTPDRGLARSISARGQNEVYARFGFDRMIRKLSELYRS